LHCLETFPEPLKCRDLALHASATAELDSRWTIGRADMCAQISPPNPPPASPHTYAESNSISCNARWNAGQLLNDYAQWPKQ